VVTTLPVRTLYGKWVENVLVRLGLTWGLGLGLGLGLAQLPARYRSQLTASLTDSESLQRGKLQLEIPN